MSKRFIDTGIFEDSWFMELSKDAKLLWIYLITKCDHAGIIERNFKLFEFHTGINSIDTVMKELGNRIVTVNEHYIFIPKFLTFQYPQFPNSKVKAQESALAILRKFGIDLNGMVTVSQVLPNAYGNDNDNGNGNDINAFKQKFENSESFNVCKITASRNGIKGDEFQRTYEKWIGHFVNQYPDYMSRSVIQLGASLTKWILNEKDFNPSKKKSINPALIP